MMGLIMFMIGLLFINLFNFNLKFIFMQNIIFLMICLILFYWLNLNYYNNWLMIDMEYGLDKISFLMILLSFFIICLMYLSILNLNLYYLNLLNMQFIILLFSLILFFMSINLMSFYIFFEISMIPVFMMILGWGNQPERLWAGIYLLMYMLFSSLPFLLILIYMWYSLGSLNIMYLYFMKYYFLNYFIIYLLMIFVFLVKLPIYLFHFWLPKAHVEAPIFGSMSLAGVMLKLGSYGLLRIILINILNNMMYNLMLIIFILFGSMLISIICMRQIDLKMLIAYSSVVHMGILISGIFSGFLIGIKGSLIMMISHGLCSSGLFCLLNFNYVRVGSRNMILNKGLGLYYSNMMMWWFLFCVMNMSSPPSLNLVSEIMLIISMMKISQYIVIILFFLLFFSGAYSIYLYSFSQHGFLYFYNMNIDFNLINEYLLMILHWIPMNFLFLGLFMF